MIELIKYFISLVFNADVGYLRLICARRLGVFPGKDRRPSSNLRMVEGFHRHCQVSSHHKAAGHCVICQIKTPVRTNKAAA